VYDFGLLSSNQTLILYFIYVAPFALLNDIAKSNYISNVNIYHDNNAILFSYLGMNITITESFILWFNKYYSLLNKDILFLEKHPLITDNDLFNRSNSYIDVKNSYYQDNGITDHQLIISNHFMHQFILAYILTNGDDVKCSIISSNDTLSTMICKITNYKLFGHKIKVYLEYNDLQKLSYLGVKFIDKHNDNIYVYEQEELKLLNDFRNKMMFYKNRNGILHDSL